MKMRSDSSWSASHLLKWAYLFSCIGLACATATFVVGCNKRTQTPSTALPSAQAQTNSTQPAPTTQQTIQPGQVTDGATNAMPDLRPLNRALLGWIVQNRRRPISFEEFAASAKIAIPPPPPGKKYIIDSRGLISLVDGSPN